MTNSVSLALLLIPAVSLVALADRESDAIRPWPDNPRYWQYKGEPLLLLGGSDEDNLFNDPDLMEANLAAMAACGANYIRGTLSCRDPNNVWPFELVNDKYDLDRFNPEFWRRLEACCNRAEQQDVIVQIEVWATFDYYREHWLRNPFNPANNVNYSTESTTLVEEWDFHPAANPQAFFRTPPELNDDAVVRGYQEAFVRKVLDVTLPYPNVLYCMDNETRAPKEWAWYWAAFMRDEAASRGATVQLTEMWDNWSIQGEEHAATYTRPDLFTFTDVSQNNWNIGRLHYDRLLWYRENLAEQPGGIRPMNNVKVYGRLRPGEGDAIDHNIDRWWQNIWAGCAGTRFHRPDTGIGLNEVAQAHIKAARAFTDAFDVFSCEPMPQSLSGDAENEAYVLAEPGVAYAVYFPLGGEVTLDVSAAEGPLQLRWFDMESATFMPATQVEGPAVTLTSPTTGQVSLALVTR